MKKLLLLGFVFFACNDSEKSTQNESINPTTSIEKYYHLNFSPAERDSLFEGLERNIANYKALHGYYLDNSIPPAINFNPIPAGYKMPEEDKQNFYNIPKGLSIPESDAEIAFLSLAELSSLIKERKLTSQRLTKIYLDRLKKYGDTLKCVVTITEEIALKEAKKADAEIAAGKYRGPLHGIPYGVKDLLTVEGYKTTWGAMPYKDQEIKNTATVVQKLEEAGAVLVAKLSMGALAMGDVWFKGVTKNPWNMERGSSGSSAGSASATVAGLVGFSIGTETLGSIVSPSTRCGASGLRPSYSRVSRSGAMALSWTMDKIGPICRTALDCAIVFDAIRGEDGIDQTLVDAPFNFNARKPLSELRIGYIKEYFETENPNPFDSAALETIKQLGVIPEEVKMPNEVPIGALRVILVAEAAAAFDSLTRSADDDLLVRQGKGAWPNIFRTARFIPAVEYINANRIRYELVQKVHEVFKDYDVIITPSYGGSQLLVTNLTGSPCVVVPSGFDEDGNPKSISFIGDIHKEGSLLELAHAYQKATKWEDRHPEAFY